MSTAEENVSNARSIYLGTRLTSISQVNVDNIKQSRRSYCQSEEYSNW